MQALIHGLNRHYYSISIGTAVKALSNRSNTLLADCLVQALIHGLNRHYYSISINYRKNPLEEQMLLNLQKKAWQSGLTLRYLPWRTCLE